LKMWNDGSISHGGRGCRKTGTYMVPMKDGTNLATDVYLPADYKPGEKLPTIMLRTCYNKNDFCKYDAFFTDRGYAVVGQDVRGRSASEGEFISGYYERNDGDDTLNWIAAQPWSDGNVGTIGGSYEGYNQWLQASSGNPHLKAMIPISSAGSPFIDVDRRSGTYPMMILPWYIVMADKEPDFSAYESTNWDEVYKMRPLKDIVHRVKGCDAAGWGKMFEHPDYDEYWRQATFSDPRYSSLIQVPTLVIDGFYDGDLPGNYEGWELLKRNNVEARKIIYGPWIHYTNTTRKTADYEFGLNATRYDFDYLWYQWFDRYLKGIDNGVDKVRAEYYCAIDNQWHEASEWPPTDSTHETLYLSGSGTRCLDREGGQLSNCLEKEESCDIYLYNPADPTPYIFDPSTIEGNNPEDYAAIEDRPDVLTYTSRPFANDVRLTGTPKVVIYAESSARDTDWVVRLTRVTDEGRSFRIMDDIIRARYRKGFDQQVLLTPGVIERYEFNLFYVSQLLKKGERIRLEIASAMNGITFPNPNTGKPIEDDLDAVVATQKIHHGGRYDSQVILPLIEESVNDKK
jgi:putative CocE/NonD family hydrolase